MSATAQPIIIVGICGYKQSGKDTICKLLFQFFNPTCYTYRFAFADKLKDEVCEMLSITRDELEANKEKYRGYLQSHGQEAKEIGGDFVWIKEVAKKIQQIRDGECLLPQIVVITDCRFPFEAKWIKELGGFLVKVERFSDTTDEHISETSVRQIRDVDYHIPNKGSLRDLERECKWLSQIIKIRYKLPVA